MKKIATFVTPVSLPGGKTHPLKFMKLPPFFLLVLFLFSFHLEAQIPNAEFELWNDSGDYENPDGWYTENELYQADGMELVRSTSDSYSSLYAVRMENEEDDNDNVVRAMMVSGTNSLQNSPGFPYSHKPASLNGFYQFSPKDEDSCYVIVQLTKYNAVSNSREMIGEGRFGSDADIDSYQPFTVPISYLSSEFPDTATIIIYSGKFQGAEDGSRLIIDALTFDEATGVVIIDTDELKVKVSPNPAGSFLTVSLKSSILNLLTNLTIYNEAGEVVIAMPLVGSVIDISLLPSGTYYLEVTNAVTNKIIGTATFMVQK